jgi:hypothetical protein
MEKHSKMRINPTAKSVTYSISDLADVEAALNSIEKTVLENDSVTGQVARHCCAELNAVRDSLGLKRGVQQHEKF